MGDFNNGIPKNIQCKIMETEYGARHWCFLQENTNISSSLTENGKWKKDPQNAKTCLNCFGTQNSVLNLEEI